jgi:DNA polymerase elongation subunit (family B)
VLGRHLSPIIDDFVDDLAKALFDSKNPDDVLRLWNRKKILSYPLKAFVQYATFSKQPDSYQDSSMYASLIAQLRKAGITVDWGSKVSFCKTKSGYTPSMLMVDASQIDVSYYQSRMCDVASRILGRPFKDLKFCFDGNVKMELWFT